MKSSTYITHEEVRDRAHKIWEKSGRPEGQDAEHWLQAEKELQQERDQSSQAKGGNSGAGSAGSRSNGAKSNRHQHSGSLPSGSA
jgi:hypothetical protein